MNRKEYLSKGIIYQVSSIIVQLIGIFLIPLYTRHLTTDEFGLYNIITSIISLMSLIINLGIFSGLSRFYNEFDDKHRVKNIAITFSLVWGSVCIAIFLLFSSFFAKLLFNSDPNGIYYLFSILAISFIMGLVSVYTSFYSMQFKALKVCSVNIARIILVFVFSMYFVLLRKSGTWGLLKSLGFSEAIILLTLISGDYKNLKFLIGKGELKPMFKYGIGLLPGNASAWVLNLVDRYFLKYMVNLSTVAVYSMGYKIGMLIEPLLITPFNRMFTPYVFKVYKEEMGREKIRSLYNYYNFFCWFVILGISLFANTAISILSTSEYSGAYRIVPLISISYYFYGLGSFYCIGFQIANKTIIDSIILVLGALINIVFNYILIPLIGMYGAATATMLAYIFVNTMYYIFGRRYYNLGINFFQPFKNGSVYLFTLFIYYFTKKYFVSMLYEILFSLLLCGFYLLSNLMLGLISYKEIKEIFNKTNNHLSFKICIHKTIEKEKVV